MSPVFRNSVHLKPSWQNIINVLVDGLNSIPALTRFTDMSLRSSFR